MVFNPWLVIVMENIASSPGRMTVGEKARESGKSSPSTGRGKTELEVPGVPRESWLALQLLGVLG